MPYFSWPKWVLLVIHLMFYLFVCFLVIYYYEKFNLTSERQYYK